MNRFALVALLVLSGCSVAPQSQTVRGDATSTPVESTRGVVVLTAGERQRRAKLKVGDELVVRLPADHQAGMTWTRVSRIEGRMLTLRSGHYVEDSEAAILARGATGFETFTMRALKPGRHRLVFEYRPPWSRSGRPEKTARFTVVIRDDASAEPERAAATP